MVSLDFVGDVGDSPPQIFLFVYIQASLVHFLQ